MKFIVKSIDPQRQRSACFIVGIYENAQLTSTAKNIDRLSGGYLSKFLKHGDFSGRSGQKQFLYDIPHIGAARLLLVGCGKQQDLTDTQFRSVVTTTDQALTDAAITEAVSYLTDIRVKDRDALWQIRIGSETLVHQSYRFTQLKSSPNNGPTSQLKQLSWHLADAKLQKPATKAAHIGQAIANGMALTRNLGNLPGNICTPTYLAQSAQKLGRSHKIKVKVLDQKQMEKLRMGSFLSVAKGSRQPPRLIIMEYRGTKPTAAPIVLVGKGITFDSGGISIKPSAAMDEMKFDMCGAASVLGTLQVAAELQLPINIVGLVPTCENLPDGNANKPGDIVTSMSGQTIEILNTDAEGRLILCDALTYAERYKPKAVIDIATLTGACVIALGSQASGLMGNDQDLMNDILNAGQQSTDRAWQLPLWEEYQEQLKSNFADMANIGGREAGTITAACFLSRFAKKFKWAHLDIAGVAWLGGSNKGATGRPVPLLSQYLINISRF